ncbi:MAG: vWA domain-containing protein [Hyphomonas sp.]
MNIHTPQWRVARRRAWRAGLSAAAIFTVSAALPVQAQEAESASILILDASGSMWGQLKGGTTKIEVARDVMGEYFRTRNAAEPLGVIAYGHRRRGDCADIEVIAPTGVQDAATLSSRVNQIRPNGMTPLTDAIRMARTQIPKTAERADIILVTDGLETCKADPCALAAELAAEGIEIRAHVVGFGLTEQEAASLSCIPEATGGLLLRPQTGQELSDALDQIAEAEPPPPTEAFFDIGPKAEAGHTYRVSYKGTAKGTDYAGFTKRGAPPPSVSGSYGVIGGGATANNPFSVIAPSEPGEYDLILSVPTRGVIERQPIEVVPASNGFDAIGRVEPGKRFTFTWRGPDQVGHRIAIANPGDPGKVYSKSWGYSLHKNGKMGLTAPAEPGIYEMRYVSGGYEILFSRTFSVGVPYQDEDQPTSAELSARAATATQGAATQDDIPMVRATFRLPKGAAGEAVSWSAIPLDVPATDVWAPPRKRVTATGEFEPGRYEVSAVSDKGAEYRAVVDILPGQPNDFTLTQASSGGATSAPAKAASQPVSQGGSNAAASPDEAMKRLSGAPMKRGALSAAELEALLDPSKEN